MGEEDVGVWRFAADPGASTAGALVAAVDGVQPRADAEGVALATDGAPSPQNFKLIAWDAVKTALGLP